MKRTFIILFLLAIATIESFAQTDKEIISRGVQANHEDKLIEAVHLLCFKEK